MQDPSLIDIFTGGGPLMLVVVLWLLIALLFSYLIFTEKLNRSRSVLLIFPLGFLVLAVTQWVLQWHFHFTEFLVTGSVDPMVYAENSLRISRSTLMICWAAGLSLLAVFVLLLVRRKPSGANSQSLGEQNGAGRHPSL
jgi:hypothetical protein